MADKKEDKKPKVNEPTAEQLKIVRNKIQKYGLLPRGKANVALGELDVKKAMAILKEDDCEKCQKLVVDSLPEALKPKKKTESKLDK